VDGRRHRAEGRHPHRTFNGVNIDVPEGKETSVGHFSIFFTQTGGVSTQAGNTAKLKHPSGCLRRHDGTGSVNGKNDEQIEGLELRYETGRRRRRRSSLRFIPRSSRGRPTCISVDGKGFAPYRRENGDHTTLHILGTRYDLGQIFTYAGSGYDSFFGIVSDQPFDKISFTAGRRRRSVANGQRVHRQVGAAGEGLAQRDGSQRAEHLGREGPAPRIGIPGTELPLTH
jgi:hypothetical protein